jgi:hypothetical protein
MANPHEKRIHNAVNAFEEANASMVRLLEALNDEAAKRAPSGGGWNAAQVGYHVAISNELFAGILAGAVPMAKPAPPGFNENPNVFSNVPSKVSTFPALEPPAAVSRDEALSKLRSAQAQIVGAIKALSPDSASGRVMELPFGAITMYQAAEFAGAHIHRHIAQIQRCTASS